MIYRSLCRGKVIKRETCLRLFSASRVIYINPFLPIDPTEIATDLQTEDENKQKQCVQKAKGRIKHMLSQQRTINGKKNNSGGSGSGGPGGNEDGGKNPDKNRKKRGWKSFWNSFSSLSKKLAEAGLITLASLGILVIGGMAYHKLYKQNVLWKIEESFNTGDSSLMIMQNREGIENGDGVLDTQLWAERPHQKLIDEIIKGEKRGKYYLLLGEKGTGKTSTVMESIKRVNGKDCAIIDCSSDVEIMRLRIGSALNFEFFEDYIGSLFSMKGPRETTPILDIERAFMKLEKILTERKKETSKPLILIFNNSHLIDSSLVELLQQKAEYFSSSGMLTTMFISDDYWLFEKLKILATRLQLINFEDAKFNSSIKIINRARLKRFNEFLSEDECKKIYTLIGGRPQHLNHVVSSQSYLDACEEVIQSEATWFLNNCTLLGADMDDDVVESGKFSTSAMLLMRELVELDRKKKKTKNKGAEVDPDDQVHLPELPLWRARQIMTRPDYIQEYDRRNIFTIDAHSNVRADSVPMMQAFHRIASSPNFDSLLQETIDRVSEIESLQRTREIVSKDLGHGKKYKLSTAREPGGYYITLEDESENAPFEMKVEDHEGERKKWWKRRWEAYLAGKDSKE